jgi:hypothetical protein
MSTTGNSPERRDQAIKKFNDRIHVANQKAAEKEANIRLQEERRQKLYEDWPRLADGIITSSVTTVSDDFVKHGSPVFFAASAASAGAGPQRQSDKNMQANLATSPRSFDVRHQGHNQALARLQFEVVISTGTISATTTAKNVELPPPVLLSEFEPQWASKAAEAVLLAILEA